jgi:cytochrome c-type biogenesis protein CcmH
MRNRLVHNRVLHLALLFAAALTMLGAGNSTTTLDRIGHKLVCQCGCGQILMECNHVGCPVSPVMIAELHAQLDAGQSETAILNTFIAKYGPIVLASPIRGGFDIVAWVVPFAVLLLGALGLIFLLRRSRSLQLAAPTPPVPTDDQRERINRDTE